MHLWGSGSRVDKGVPLWLSVPHWPLFPSSHSRRTPYFWRIYQSLPTPSTNTISRSLKHWAPSSLLSFSVAMTVIAISFTFVWEYNQDPDLHLLWSCISGRHQLLFLLLTHFSSLAPQFWKPFDLNEPSPRSYFYSICLPLSPLSNARLRPQHREDAL